MRTITNGIRIAFAAVTKSLAGRQVLTGVDVACAPGRLTVLLGHNGSGKSTALGILLGLTSADSGSATFGDRELRDYARARRIVGAVLDRPTAAAGRTAADHLRVVGHGLVDRATQQEALERAGLAEVAGDRVGTYSLGMRQRLAVAAATLHRPASLVMDEPHNGLDPEGVGWLHDTLREHCADGGTALVATHRIREALDVADDVVVLQDGEVAQSGPARSFRLRSRVTVEVLSEADTPTMVRGLSEGGCGPVESEGSRIRVEGADTARVAAVAGNVGVPLVEVAQEEPTLTDLLLEG